MRKPFTLEEFNDIYSKVPRLCVDVVLVTDEGVLLTKRSIKPDLGWWHIPGGSVYFGETLEQTVKRVAKDELGLEVEVTKLLGVEEFPNYYAKHSVSLAHLVKIKSGEIKLSNEASEYGFFKEMPKKTIREQKVFLETYMNSKT